MQISFSTYLQDVREKKGLTYAALSDMTGLSKSSISRIEKGDMGINFGTSLLIADALGTTIQEFYELMSGRKYEVALPESRPSLCNYPSIGDLENFEKLMVRNLPKAYQRLADQLNLIFIKTEDKVLQFHDPKEYQYSRCEVARMMIINPVSTASVNYPELFKLSDIALIYKERGAVIVQDLHSYCVRLMGELKRNDKKMLTQASVLLRIPQIGSANDIKLSSVIEVDSYSPVSGEFFSLCNQAIELENLWEKRPHTASKVLILASRWRKSLKIPNDNWLSELISISE